MASGSESSATSRATCNEIIGTYSCPDCYLCGSQGEALYSDLADRLFDAPGKWDLKRCPAPECGLLWLDPMPREDEIGKAYQTYYTHADVDAAVKTDAFRRLYRAAKLAYVHTYYGANGAEPSLWSYIAALPVWMVRSVHDGIDVPRKYLAARRGRMLDVGCGNGDLVEMARDYGWQAEGIDLDAKAIANARGKGLNVRLGMLAEQAYPDSTFDLITMSHVIEHLHDPVSILRESYRLIKGDGLLVVSTPNTASVGHRKFGPYWRGLEPPRHLRLFNPRTLAEVARRASFENRRVASTLSLNLSMEMISRRIREEGDLNAPFSTKEVQRARLISLALQIRLWFSPLAGDEILLEARK
jgi:2-polyprenyl-3-methyl-5-hydroxy-6-metoxy-1,4-benzoquinol methylase